MRKTFEIDYGNGVETEEFEVDYIVLFGVYDNEHPEDHYKNRKSNGKVYETIEEAKEKAEGCCDSKIWEVVHAIDTGDIIFFNEIK